MQRHLSFDSIDVRDNYVARSTRIRSAKWLTAGFWLFNYVMLVANDALGGRYDVSSSAMIRALLSFVGIGICLLLHRLLMRLAHWPFRKRALTIVALSPIAAEGYAWINYFGLLQIGGARVSTVASSSVLFTILFWTWFFLAWAALCLALEYSLDVTAEEARSSELRVLAHDAKLRALHNQINPHFLFNSLNSISSLILDRRIEEADRMVARLANFLRITLAVDPTAFIRLDEEVALQQSYLNIEQLRFPDLAVHISVPDNLRDALVPALILQPLVENAVKYGVATAPPPAQIAIRVSCDNASLMIEVVDGGRASNGVTKRNGVAVASAVSYSGGIGLRNVRQRLEELYRAAQSFSAGPNDKGGFTARTIIPLGAG